MYLMKLIHKSDRKKPVKLMAKYRHGWEKQISQSMEKKRSRIDNVIEENYDTKQMVGSWLSLEYFDVWYRILRV